jgi:hypothetical protein
MGKGSYFMVYFRGGTTIEDADRELRSGNTVTRDGDGITIRYEEGPELFIGLSTESHVILEAEDVAERHAVPALASCDRRFEVSFDDLEAVLDETNTLFVVGATLQDLTGGYIHYSWNGNLLLPDGEPCRCPRCP